MREIKVGERYERDNGDWIRITAVGENYALARRSGVTWEERFRIEIILKDWTKTNEADGSPVEVEQPGERRLKITWSSNYGTVPYQWKSAVGPQAIYVTAARPDFIGFEDEHGNIWGRFIHKKCGAHYNFLSLKDWKSGDYEVVKFKNVVLKGQPT